MTKTAHFYYCTYFHLARNNFTILYLYMKFLFDTDFLPPASNYMTFKLYKSINFTHVNKVQNVHNVPLIIKSFLIGIEICNQYPLIMTYDELYKQGVTGIALPKKLTKQET
jgi:hypothetical protein